MSLVVALKAQGGIVLAADSRGTIGDPRGLTAINDTQVKISAFGKCGIGLAGASEMGNTLLDELRKKNFHANGQADELAMTVANECATLFSNWFKDIPPDKRPGVVFGLAGYRSVGEGSRFPLIYMLASQFNFAPQMFGDNPCLLGVPQYAVYLVHRYYDPRISLDKAKALAEYLITETASQDPKVGGPIKMASITPDMGYEELTQQQIDQIHQSNDQLNARLREFFVGDRKRS